MKDVQDHGSWAKQMADAMNAKLEETKHETELVLWWSDLKKGEQ